MSTGRKPTPIAERLWHGIEVRPNGCWVYQGSAGAGNYRQIWVGSRTDGTRRKKLAHVVSYETFVGEVPAGLELDHRCHNPPCINPQHLEAVTHGVNMARAAVHRRRVLTGRRAAAARNG